VTNPARVCMAVDPGLAHVGYGLVGRYGAKLDLVDSGHIPTPPDWDLNDRLRKIWRDLATVCRDVRPTLMGVENQAPASIGARMQGLKAAAKGEKAGGFSANNDPVFEVVGIAKAVAFSYGIPVLLYSPQQAKIAVCGPGSGRATKQQVMQACRVYFPGIERDGHRLGEHEADAIAGAIYVERVTLLQSRRAG
jgi:crossover junction endodeoxyribonuclease RuvC